MSVEARPQWGIAHALIDDDRQLVGVVIQTAIAAHRGAATSTAPE
jgi:hypothetical protein